MSFRVSISGPSNQLGIAIEVRNCLDRHNVGVVDRQKVEVLFFGGVALDLYWKLWSKDLEVNGHVDARRVQRELSVYSTDQVLEARLYIDPGSQQERRRTRQLTEATTILVSTSDSIRGRLPRIESHISLLEPGNPFAKPNCVVFDIRSEYAHARVPIPHPPLFLLHSIRQIQLMTDQIRIENEGFVNWRHRNGRSAQARLLRLFVDLLDLTGHSNTSKSDAIWPLRIQDQTILEFPGQVAEEVLNEAVARDAAEWEAGMEGLGMDANHVDRLFQLYVGAFEQVKRWVSTQSCEDKLAATDRGSSSYRPLVLYKGANLLDLRLPHVSKVISSPVVYAT